MTTISTSDRQIYRHPKAVVYVAAALRNADFVEQPYLRCELLRRAVAPEIDQCQLTYHYGEILREDRIATDSMKATDYAYSPLDLVGKFVKVVITDTVYADAFALDPATTETDQTITWVGIIEFDERELNGSSPAPDNTPSGVQQITAYGLLRLADKEPVRTSFVDVDGTDANRFEAKCGLTFNVDQGGQFVQRGNRSAAKVVDGSAVATTYLFSWEPRGLSEWSAFNAVEYLLKNHSPTKADGTHPNVWRFETGIDTDLLDWYEISQPTDGMTLKQLLDALIPRFRSVGYYVDFATATDEIVLHAFTFNSTDITLPNTRTLKANPNQRALDFEHSYDITQASVGNATTQQYHRIVARGAKRTTTFTARVGTIGTYGSTVILLPSWEAADETEYKAGASAAADYASLSTAQQQARNAIYRQSNDRLREVYRRFVLNTQVDATPRWNGFIKHPHQTVFATNYWLRGDQSVTSYTAVYDSGSTYDGRDFIPALRIMRGLPLYERKDYSGSALASFSYGSSFTDETHPSFIPLIAYARTKTGSGEYADGETANPHRYELLDRLHQKSFDATSNRDWSCRVHVVDTEPGIELIADVPHFIGGTDAGGTGWAITADEHKSSQHGGIAYTDIWVTMCVELTERVEQEVTVAAPAANAPEQVLFIDVPDARFDYVIPHTTVEIKDGIPIETSSGGAAKDDRLRLKSIATAAAEWYSTKRQTLDLQWQQIRASFELGWLITDVGAQYQLTDINTPITAITYNLGGENSPGQMANGNTRIETSYAAMDFQ